MPRVREADAGVIAPALDIAGSRLAFVLAMFVHCRPVARRAASAQTRRPNYRRAPAPPRRPASRRSRPYSSRSTIAGDVDISDVFFVDADTGWACGHHRTERRRRRLHHRDARRRQNVVGAVRAIRSSSTGAVARLFFLDATHGWATQVDGTLLRTTDGSTWTTAGTCDPRKPVRVHLSRKRLLLRCARRASSRRWTAAARGRLGYRRDVPAAIAFAPDRVHRLRGARAALEYRTRGDTQDDRRRRDLDAGVAHPRHERDATSSLAFPDAFTGYLRAGSALKMTTDGGRTWHAVTARCPDDASKFASRVP